MSERLGDAMSLIIIYYSSLHSNEGLMRRGWRSGGGGGRAGGETISLVKLIRMVNHVNGLRSLKGYLFTAMRN